jgi:hypothetical protein
MIMAQININLLLDAENLIKSNVKDFIDDNYVIMTDDQIDDVYVDCNASQLIARVNIGDELIWTIKSRSGIAVYFNEIIINCKKRWFEEEGGKPVIDPSRTKITGTISKDIKSGDVCSYTLRLSLDENLNEFWSFDPLIEARTHTP